LLAYWSLLVLRNPGKKRVGKAAVGLGAVRGCFWLYDLQTLIRQIQFLKVEQHELHFVCVSILDMDMDKLKGHCCARAAHLRRKLES
jgi:hypothetical protein